MLEWDVRMNGGRDAWTGVGGCMYEGRMWEAGKGGGMNGY